MDGVFWRYAQPGRESGKSLKWNGERRYDNSWEEVHDALERHRREEVAKPIKEVKGNSALGLGVATELLKCEPGP